MAESPNFPLLIEMIESIIMGSAMAQIPRFTERICSYYDGRPA